MPKKDLPETIFPDQILSQFAAREYSSFVSRDTTLRKSHALTTPLIQNDLQFLTKLRNHVNTSKYPYRSFSPSTDSKYAVLVQKTNTQDFVKTILKEETQMIKPDSHFITHIVAAIELIEGFFDVHGTSKLMKDVTKNYYVRDDRYGNYGCFYLDFGKRSDMSMQNHRYDVMTIGVIKKNYILTVIKVINDKSNGYLSKHLPQTPFIDVNLQTFRDSSSILSWIGKDQKKQYDSIIKSHILDFRDKGWFEKFKQSRKTSEDPTKNDNLNASAPSYVSSNISWNSTFGSVANLFTGSSKDELDRAAKLKNYFS